MDLDAQALLLNQNPQLLKTGQLVAISQFGQAGKYREPFFITELSNDKRKVSSVAKQQ
jgi:hypothetical protein